MSRRKAGGAPRTPLGTISASSNIAPGPLPSPGAPRSPRREAAPASPRWISTAVSPGLSDSLVSEHVSFIADTLAREPTDEDAHQQLRSAIKARHENEALRERLEHLKNSEIDQGLAASERMREMSSEYVHRVDHLTREKDSARARADNAEARARALQDVLRANGIEVPKGPETAAADSENREDPDVSIGGGGVPATFPFPPSPAAALFASPSPADADLELALTLDDRGETKPDASFDFGGGQSLASARADADASDASEVSLDSDALRVGAEDAALSFYETQSASEAFARTPRGGDVSAPHLHAAGLHAAATPSGDAAEAAAREAMATLDHPALVDEASGLVATNVRLERERRALVGRLETLMSARARSSPPGSARRLSRDDDRELPPHPANAVRAATQLSEALDRVAAAASRAATLLDEGERDSSPSGIPGIPPSTPGGTSARERTPGGTLNKALRRMKAHGHRVPAEGQGPDEDRRREAREAAEEASQAASLASMQRDLLMEALEAAPSRHAPTPDRVESTRAPSVSPPAAPLDVISTPPAPQPPSAAQAATARAERAERELVRLRRRVAAEASRANEDRVESRYAAAQSAREVERLTAELAAATGAAQTAQDIAARRQKQAASLEAKHTRLSIELSTAMQALRETEREARAEEKRLSLSFRIDAPAPNAAVSQSPLVVVGTPPNLAPIQTDAKARATGSADAKRNSPIASLVRQVSATREGLAAALAAADAAAKAGDAEDETAALVRDLRAQLGRARADAADALARAEAAEGAGAGSPRTGSPEVDSPSSPSPSPIARARDATDAAALEDAADELGMNGADWPADAGAALASAKAEAASATAAAETLRGELGRAREALAAGAEERERLGLDLERAREEEARLSLSLEQARRGSAEAFSLSSSSSAEVSRLTAELEAAKRAAGDAEEALEMAKRAAKAWKEQQTSAVRRWMETATARAVAAESALAASKLDKSSTGTASDSTSKALVAENRELTSLAERRTTEAETLELRVAELAERAEAAEKSAADAPHLRAENYDLAVKHRAGLRRLHQELTARRELEERVQGYEHATAALEATVKQLEVALKQAMDMCAEAKSASAAAAAERAAAEARSPAPAASGAGTPASSRGSVDGSAASPDDRALAARAETLAAAVEAAERDAAAAREETARAEASAATAALEAKNALEVAEARRADLAVLRDECSKLRWKVLEMEEDARVSPSPRHGGRPREPLPSDSPFSSMKTFGRFAEAEAASPTGDGFSLADAFVDPDETLALTPPVQGRGAGSAGALDLTRDVEREAATREAAEEVSRAADAVRAENESLAAALAEARAEKARLAAETVAAREEAAASASRAEAAEARAHRLSASVGEKARQAERASAELDAATFAKTSAEAAARARQDDAAEAKAAVKALRAELRALETAAAEASAARAAAECAAAEARREASEARAEAMREASAAEAAHEARRRAEEAAVRLAKHAASEAADAAATAPTPPPLAFKARVDAPSPSTALALRPTESSAEAAAAAALAAMAATAAPAGAEAFAATLRECTRRLREDVARARDEVATHKARAARMKAEIDRLATDLPARSVSAVSGASSRAKALPATTPELAAAPAADPTRAAYYKSVAKKLYGRMKSQKAAYELQIAGLRQQIELVALPSLNTTNASFSATPTPRRTDREAKLLQEDDANETPPASAT